MKPIYGIVIGSLLILAGIVRLLANRDSSIMDQVINITFFLGLCVGVAVLMYCLKKETEK